MLRFGIVIPAYNEETFIEATMQSLASFQEAGDCIVVVDACCTDATAKRAQKMGGWVVRSQIQSRGLAVALGVNKVLERAPNCDAVIIAHADSVFPPQGRACLVDALERHPNCPGGAYGHRICSRGWAYRIIERGNNFRANWLQMAYGDQAQFFRPNVLQKYGGFPQQEALEDVELSLRLRQAGPLVFLNCPVAIPPRHWSKGVVRTTLSNWFTVWRYLAQRPKRAEQAEPVL